MSGTAIVGIGARTPVGIGSAAAAAAIRAGITALAQHPFLVDSLGDMMPAAIDALLDAGLIGTERLLMLAETALSEACEPLFALDATRLRLAIYVGLPEPRPGFEERDAAVIRTGLTCLERLPTKPIEVRVFPLGHAAGFRAFETAIHQLRQGAADACLVGGVDSYFHPATMEWLDANRQLVGSVSRSGFVPGEGAAFSLLMSERAHAWSGLPALARFRSIAVGKETNRIKTDDVCFGEGLSLAVQNAVSALHQPEEKINAIYCDINGERYRSEEWGFVSLRLGEYFDDPTGYFSPAECWGDMGAASGPLFVMLACRAAQRGYANGAYSLLWASSEGGERGAAVILTEGNE